MEVEQPFTIFYSILEDDIPIVLLLSIVPSFFYNDFYVSFYIGFPSK